jgi:aldehyde dehydrogenase (NAD+)
VFLFVYVLKIKMLKSTLKRFINDSDQMARIVNARHFQRLSGLLKDPSVAASILHGGQLDAKNLLVNSEPNCPACLLRSCD